MPLQLSTDALHHPGFLEFAGIESPSIPTLAIEIHLAEKLHAYSKLFPGDRQSTRVKDLVDIVLIGQSISLGASPCAIAIRQTFKSRNRQPLPNRLGPAPAAWSSTYPPLAQSVGLDPDVAVGHAYAASLLDPLLGGALGETAVWNHLIGEWREDAH